MDFEELYNYCVKLNESTCEKCLVCHIPIETTDMHLKFKCSHYYHMECIKYKSGKLQCIYCEKVSIPSIINNTITSKLKSTNNTNSCNVIMKTGSRKNMMCGRIDCKYHKTNIVNEENNICNHIIKIGNKAGQQCKRLLPCHYHKIKELEI
jgi:hypothetical protein